jgi:hypothetical protein
MDITDSLAPTSDQLDAIDLMTGPRTFTVEKVTKNNAEQPYNVHLVEFPRVWRPGKNMRRVLAACWGVDASKWTGRRVTLFMDPDVTFGKEKPGGTRIAAVSHIDGAKTVTLMVTRGKTAQYRVEPIAEADPTPTVAVIAAEGDKETLRRWWNDYPARRKEIEARVAELNATPATDEDGIGEFMEATTHNPEPTGETLL